jgi:hypothetical protein
MAKHPERLNSSAAYNIVLRTHYQSEGKGLRTDKESPLGNSLAL